MRFLYISVGLLIAKDYQDKNVQFLEKNQSRNKSQVVQITRPERFWTCVGSYLFLLKARLLGQVHGPYKTGCVAHELQHSN